MRYVINILVLVALDCVLTFNIDSEATRLTYNIEASNSVENQSNFGYSLSFFNTTKSGYRLFIGAPKYNKKRGGLFECGTTSLEVNCSQIHFANDSSSTDNLGILGDAEQLGSLIKTTSNELMVCSPTWNLIDPTVGNSKHPIFGRCLTLDRNLTIQKYESPCRRTYHPHSIKKGLKISSYGMSFCVSGRSAEIIETENETLHILDNVGAWEYKGGFVVTKGGKIISNFTNLHEISDEASDLANSSTSVSSLLGYATASGSFHGPGTYGVVATAPFQNSGEVMVYKLSDVNGLKKLILTSTITNAESKFGYLFGGSVAAIDYNGDGYDDLVVGLPIYSSSRHTGYDEGRVYIYRNTQQGKVFVKETYELFGMDESRARFGTTIINTGDLNGDGYDDLAISAPFGGVNGTGSVFIYNVRNKQINEIPSQIIESPGGYGFGYSMNAQKIDTRIYPTLAIGAPLSDQVYLYKARNIITLSDYQWINVSRVDHAFLNSNCRGPDSRKYHCVMFGVMVEDKSLNAPSSFDIQVTIGIDTDRSKMRRRGFFLNATTNVTQSMLVTNLNIERGHKKIINSTVYFLISNDTDFNDVIIRTRYEALQTTNNCEGDLCAVLDPYGTTSNAFDVKYLRRDCGKNHICDVDLAIEQSRVEVSGRYDVPLLIGSTVREVIVHAVVSNRNESAYLTRMSITFNNDFQLVKILMQNAFERFVAPENVNDTFQSVDFLLANPLPAQKKLTIKARFLLREDVTEPASPSYDFKLKVTSSDNDYNPSNNDVTESVTAGIESCLRIKLDGNESTPVHYYENDKDDIVVSHDILIQNGGRLPLKNISVTFPILTEVHQHPFISMEELIPLKYATCMGIEESAVPASSRTPPSTNPSTLSTAEKSFYSIDHLNCTVGKCKVYKCTLNMLPVGELSGFKISLKYPINNLKKLKPKDIKFDVSVKFGGSQAALIRQKKNCTQEIQIVQLFKKLEKNKVRQNIQWILPICIVAALILLACFCAILYRIGFFKRHNRHLVNDKAFNTSSQSYTVHENTNDESNRDED